MNTSKSDAYCEPCCIKDGHEIEIHHVGYIDNEDYHCEMHFHEVQELIFFEQVEGVFHYHQGETTLEPFDVVYTPAMESHDFDLTEQAKSWYIVQFPKVLFETHQFEALSSLFEVGMHLRLPPEFQGQLLQIIRWAHESFKTDKYHAKSIALLNLALVMLKEHGKVLNVQVPRILSSKLLSAKIQPVMEIFRKQTSVILSLEDAAKKCHLSPSYFSRVFKSIFCFSYSEYVVRHRLYHAARMLGQSRVSITQLSYDLNFSNPSHFIAQFKKQYGCTPNRYRKAIIAKYNKQEA
ncbi:MAG: AraC family transcriptional regulator [Paraglaciecola sp.]|uniref:helix-turn-helix domain-containing protein n=1 Tax=Paraglaciecola sp. TaxID=1920173 RepID=UPI003296C985